MTNPVASQPVATPSADIVSKFHTNDDVDSSVVSHHHTLGIQHNQSSPGDHKHDGKSSKKIGKGLNVGFPTTASATYSQSQIQSIIDALRAIGFGS